MEMIDLEVIQRDSIVCVTRYINALAYVDLNMVSVIFVLKDLENNKQHDDKAKIHSLRKKMYQMFLDFLSEDHFKYEMRLLALNSVLSHVETAFKNTIEKPENTKASLDGIWKTPQVIIEEAHSFLELIK